MPTCEITDAYSIIDQLLYYRFVFSMLSTAMPPPADGQSLKS